MTSTWINAKRGFSVIILLLLVGSYFYGLSLQNNAGLPPVGTSRMAAAPDAFPLALSAIAAPQLQAPAAGNGDKSVPATDPAESAYSAYVFDEFEGWMKRYDAAASDEARTALESEGQLLALMRRQVLSDLIEKSPERALKRALSAAQRQKLPQPVAQHLEKRISGRGTYAVAVTTPLPGYSVQISRSVMINGETYKAFTYGRRSGQATKENIPLHGIAVDDVMAVHESPIRLLEPGEATDPAKQIVNPDGKCPVKGVVSRSVIVDAGDHYIYTCCSTCPDEIAEQLISGEAGTGPNAGSSPDVAASSWTEGPKNVLFIRVDFSDKPGETITQANAQNLIANTVNNFYVDCSYGKTSMTCTATSQVLRLPQTSTYYASNFGALVNDSRTAANNAGYNSSSYNLHVIGCAGLGNGAAGQGYVGASGSVLYGYFDLRVTAHELGHNYGVWHANYWKTTDGTTIGAGSNEEYGDSFTVMGFGDNSGNQHFNEQMKNYFNWLTTTQVTTVTTSGTYRIFAHDQALGANKGALKVARTGDTSNRIYWGGFRQKITGNKWLMSGLDLHWGPWGSSAGGTHLLDTTPGSANGKNDAAIVIGRTFSDPAGGVFLTPIRKGGTTPESLDVVVNVGSFSTDNAPTISSISVNPTTPAPNATATLTCNASDPDGDALAFSWDFGDGNISTTSSATQSKAWGSANNYTVTCVVSDMKGKTATSSITVTVSVSGTYSVSGNITSSGAPLAGVVVSTGAASATTDTAGNYAIGNLSNGTYTLTPSKAGYSFSPTSQSVTVSSANVSGKNFTATSVTPPPNGPGTGITREWWLGIAGTAVSDLISNPAYPNSPSGSEKLTSFFEGPTNWADNYGSRIRGYFIAPVSGNYFFYLASDDNGELWLSTDNNPANRRKIANVSSWTNSREWTRAPEQKSAAIALTSGQRYYVEAFMKEGGGGDNIAVGVEYPNGSQELPIPFHRLDPWVTTVTATKLAFSVQPGNTNSGAAISPAVQVAVQDASGATVAGATNSVTLAIGTNPGGGSLGGTTTAAAVNGIATFSNLSINKSGNGYTLTAASSGLTGATSSAFNINNAAPAVTLTAPANGASFATNSNITLTASASDNDGSITKVEFFNGTTLLGTSTASPYSFTWNMVAAGSYSLSAKATDNSGASTTSNVANITVSSAGLRNPENPANAVVGLDYKYFEGAWTTLPNFDALTPVKSGVINNFSLAPRNVDGNIGFKFSGYINVPADGTYNFYTTSDDGSKLYIGTTEVVNNDGSHGMQERAGTIGLKAGKHAISVTFFQGGGPFGLEVRYDGPGISKQLIPDSTLFRINTSSGNGLLAEYYDNSDQTNLKVLRTDATVNFDWGVGSPDPSMGVDTFSVRWSGQVQALYNETYTFYTISDDGVRLWVNGQLLINNWGDHAPTENSGTIALAAGQKYSIKMEMYENGGGAVAKLSWSSATETKKIIPQSQLYPGTFVGNGTGLLAQYFDNADFTALKVTRTDATVNFNWGGGSPDATVSVDTFSVRWTGQVQPTTSGAWTFYTVSDDGVRLWVNGQLVIDNWTLHAPTENVGSISLSAGMKYDIKMEMYENGGGATAILMWAGNGVAKQVIPQTQLYPGAVPVAEPDPVIVAGNPDDTDGDGLLNVFETSVGLNPELADTDSNGITDDKEMLSGGGISYLDAQTVWLSQQNNGGGGTANPPGVLTVTRLSGGVRFNTSKRDTLSITGTVPGIPAGLKLAGTVVALDVSGAQAVFTLDAKGRGKSASGTIAVKLGANGTSASFTSRLSGGTWSGLWAEAGINNADVTGGTAHFSVQLTLAGSAYASDVNAAFSARAGKTGKFKK